MMRSVTHSSSDDPPQGSESARQPNQRSDAALRSPYAGPFVPPTPTRPPQRRRSGWWGALAPVLAVVVLGGLVVLLVATSHHQDPRDGLGRAAGAAVDTPVSELVVGDCLQSSPGGVSGGTAPVIDCAQPHAAEIYYVGSLPDADAYPAESDLREAAVERCNGAAFTDYFGKPAHAVGFPIGYLEPTAQSWAAGDRTIMCLYETADGRPTIVGSRRKS
jgi:hypothetical protein